MNHLRGTCGRWGGACHGNRWRDQCQRPGKRLQTSPYRRNFSHCWHHPKGGTNLATRRNSSYSWHHHKGGTNLATRRNISHCWHHRKGWNNQQRHTIDASAGESKTNTSDHGVADAIGLEAAPYPRDMGRHLGSPTPAARPRTQQMQNPHKHCRGPRRQHMGVRLTQRHPKG